MESVFGEFFTSLTFFVGFFFMAKCFLQNSILMDKKNGILLVLSALFDVMETKCDGGWGEVFSIVSMFLLGCCFLRGGRGRLRRLVSALESFVLFLGNIVYYVAAMHAIYDPDDSKMTFLDKSAWIYECSFLVILLVGYTYINLYRKKILVELQIWDKISMVVYFLFTMSFFCIWFVMAEESKAKLPKSFCYLVMLLITILEVLYFLFLVKKKLTDYYKKGQEYQQEYMEMELAHFREYKQAQDETRRVRHDMKNNLACISMLLEEGKNQEAKAYVSQLLGEVNAFSPKVVTGDEMLDAIVASKWSKMEERQISFSLDGVLDHGLNWKPIDICTVFSNGFDNAIEACEKAEGERKISLSLRYTRNFYYMILSNTMAEPVAVFGNDKVPHRFGKWWEKKNRRESQQSLQDTLIIGSRFTTKKNKELHGYGLENMERTIKKYDGSMDIFQDSNRFVLKIMIPVETML